MTGNVKRFDGMAVQARVAARVAATFFVLEKVAASLE